MSSSEEEFDSLNSVRGSKVTVEVLPPCFDDVLEKVGSPGRFQIAQACTGLLSYWIITFMSMSFVFLGFEPRHTCQFVNETELHQQYDILNHTKVKVRYTTCDVTISTNQSGEETILMSADCPDGRNFFGKKHTTWLSEWDLVCESRGIAELTFMTYGVGLIVGGLFTSTITDMFGRKTVFVISAVMCSVWEGLILVSPNIHLIIAFRFFAGIFRQGLAESGFIMGMELMTPKHRDIYGIYACFNWLFCLLVFGGVAYFFQDSDWRYLQGVVALSGLFFLLYPFILYESPRWLTATKRYDKAREILKKACKQNKTDFEQVSSAFEKLISTHDNDSDRDCKETTTRLETDVPEVGVKKVKYPSNTSSPNNKVSILTLFQHKNVAIVTLSLWYIWFAHNMIYYGLFMISSSLSGNRFFNFILMGLVEIPSNISVLFLLKKLKRLTVSRLYGLAAAASFIASSLLLTFGGNSQSAGLLATSVYIIGKLVVTSSYNAISVITPEIYPTNVRAIGNAACNSISRAGALLVPFLRPFISSVQWGPGVVFATVIVLSVFLTVLLPETKDRELTDNVAQLRERLERTRGEGDQDTQKEKRGL